MIASLGVRFVEQARGRGKRPVREIDGMSTELMSRWSSRRAAIEARTAELAKQFQAAHGREPTNVEIIALAQQATLESREAKHEPRSLAEQRHTWRTQAVEVLGRPGLNQMLADTLAGPDRTQSAPEVDAQWVAARAGELIATVSEARSTWQRHHVRAEALRQVRAHGLAHDGALVERLTDTALGQAFSVPHARVADTDLGEPVALRRRDGASVYSRHGVAVYTSAATLAAERRILSAVGREDGRRASAGDVELALADSAARGRTLNPGQAALVVGDGDLRTPCRARARAGRDRQDHRDGRTCARLAQLGRPRHRPGPDRRRGDRARRGPRRDHRHPRQVRVVSRPHQGGTRPSEVVRARSAPTR